MRLARSADRADGADGIEGAGRKDGPKIGGGADDALRGAPATDETCDPRAPGTADDRTPD